MATARRARTGRGAGLLRGLLLALALSSASAGGPAWPAPAPEPARRVETSRSRFARALAEAERGAGIRAHLALGEAQGLAPLVAGGWEQLRATATRLAARARTPWLRGEAQGALAAATRAGDIAVARGHAVAGGILTTGAVLGPLAGAGGDAPPPERFDPEATVPGKIAPVRWRPFADAAVTADLNVADLLGVSVDAHAFILTALIAERPRDVMIVAGSNGPLGLWLDGAPLAAWDGERPLTDWQHAVPMRLEAGVHHLLVRVGHRSEEARLILRVVDADGLRPRGLSARAPRPDDVLAAHAPSARLPAPLPALAGDDPALLGQLGLYVVSEALSQRRAAEALERAIAARPEDAELHYLLGLAERTDTSRAVLALERAVTLSGGGHGPALFALLDLYRRQGLEAGADATARALAAVEPDHVAFVSHDALRRLELGDAGAALPAVLADPRTDGNARLAMVRATLLEEAGRPRDAAAAWAVVSRLADGAPEVVRKGVFAARRAGDLDRAVAIADDALARRPYAVALHILKARALATGPGGPAAGLAALAPAFAAHPDSPELLETQGRLALLAGDRGTALAALDRALELAPQNRELAEYRRSLVSGRSLADRYAEPLADVLAATAPPVSEQGAVFLLEKHAVAVFPSGLSSQLRQLVVRIDADTASDRFDEMYFPFTPGEDRVDVVEAEVLHADGTRSRPTAIFDHQPEGKQSGVYSLNAVKVVRFGTLERGDVVHVQIRKDEIGERNLFGDFFGVVLPLSAEVPKARVEVVVEAPAGRPLYAHGERVGDPVRTVDEASGRQTLRWTAAPLPAIALEPQMPGFGDVAAYVSVSTFADWTDLARWYRDLVVPQLPLSPDLAATARRLVEGLTDVAAKVSAIQAWVLDKTRYVGIEFGIHGFKPYKVTEIVQRGYGDCKDKASLLVAMLREVGVDAEFVLIRTRDLGTMAPSPATLWAFNHAIAYVPALDAYIDGTSEFAGQGELPDLDQGGLALRIDLFDPAAPPPVLTHVPFAPPLANESRALARYVLSPSGDAVATFDESIRGSDAPLLRARLQDEARRDERIAAIIASQHPGAELVGARYESLATRGVPVHLIVTARLPGFGRSVTEGLEVPVTLAPGELLERYGMLAHRLQPLVIEHTLREVERAEVALPEGYRAAALPAPVALETPFGHFRLSFAPSPEGYVVDSELEVRVTRVAPGEYPAFRAFLEAIARAEATRVTVRRP